MTDTRPTDLLYGHLGDPVYDTESQRWHFPRQPLISRRLEPLDRSQIVVEPSHQSNEDFAPSSIERTQQIKDLTHACPELLSVTVTGILPEFAYVSETINHVVASHDPTVSDLIAFGKVVNASKVKMKTREFPCVALVAGTAGELVRFILLRKEQLGWDGHKAFGIQSLTAAGGEQGWWRGNGSPIQQLLFAADYEGNKGTLLATRYHGAISILQPVLRPGLVSPIASAADRFQLPASRIAVTLIATIETHSAGNLPFADVAFNPWDHQQLATIDQAGAWSTWDLAPPKIKDKTPCTVTRVSYGNAKVSRKTNLLPLNPVHDGWGRIIWSSNYEVLLKADRRALALAMIHMEPKAIKIPDLAMARSADWILDVKRSPTDPGQVFVVTSTRLFWLGVSVVGDMEKAKDVRIEVTVLLSWVHYRSPNDISLHLELLSEVEETLNEEHIQLTDVILHSHLTDLITVFNFKFIPSHERAVSASDPYILRTAHLQDSGEGIKRQAYNLRLRLLKYGSIQGHPSSGLAQRYMDNGVKFFHLSILHNDLSVSESLYVRLPPTTNIEMRVPNVKTRSEAPKTPLRVLDDFIVPDGVAYEDCLITKNADRPSDRSIERVSVSDAADLRTLPLEWLMDYISAMETRWKTGQEQPEPISVSFVKALEIIEVSIKEKRLSEKPGIESLLELANINPSVTNIDDGAASLAQLINNINSETVDISDELCEQRRPIPEMFVVLTALIQNELGFSSGSKLPHIYSTLSYSYISSLSRDIPAQVRITLDRTLRDIAAQLCLAAHACRLPPPSLDHDLNAPHQDAEDTPDLTFSLPVRRKASASSVSTRKGKGKGKVVPSPSLSGPPSHASEGTERIRSSAHRLTLPTPDPTPSIRTQSSASSLTSAEDAASQRLRALVSMTPQPALPNQLTEILDRWTVGSDPNSCCWTTTQQAQTVTTDTGGDEIPYPPSSQIREAKRRKRIEERVEGWSSTHPLRDRVIGGSQPIPSTLPMGSQASQGTAAAGYSGGGGVSTSSIIGSQVAALAKTQDSSDVPAITSQPLRGRHGDRKKGKSGKLKKRWKIAGF